MMIDTTYQMKVDKLDISHKVLSPTIKLLGDILGEVIVEQQGEEYLHLEEKIRLLAKDFRENDDHEAYNQLRNEIKGLSTKESLIITKAFSVFFQLSNLAEEDYRIHLNEEYNLKDKDDTLHYAIKFAKNSGLGLKELLAVLKELHLKLVWTAHPTEARRLTNLMKLRQIYETIEKIENYKQNDLEYKVFRNKIKEYVTLLWQTDDIRERKLELLDEVRTNLFYFDNTLFFTLPLIMKNLLEYIKSEYEEPNLYLDQIPNFLEFGSWVGGDRDGHPGVTSEITIQTLLLQKRLCVRKYIDFIHKLIRDLSSSLNLISISEELQDSIDEDSRTFSDFALNTQHLNKLEPYRRKLDFIRIKLENTLLQVERSALRIGLGRTLVGYTELGSNKITEDEYYKDVDDFIDDLKLIENSLIENKGSIIAHGKLSELIQLVRVFGFHLAPIDLRQHSKIHADALNEVFSHIGLPILSVLSEEQKKELLINEILNSRPLGIKSYLQLCSDDTQELFETLKVARNSIDLFSARAIEAYIISMTKDEIDILSLMLLLKEAGLINIIDGIVSEATIDIVPLFETKIDLENAPSVMKNLFATKLYRSFLEKRNNIQEIMIGYSDSTKDVGYLQSNFRLLDVQRKLIDIAENFNIKLRIFHGRGGSISRGGGPTHKAILSQLPGTLSKMKITEQGEVIGWNYANPKIAYRHLEQIISALIFRSAVDQSTPITNNSAFPRDEFIEQFQILADKASEVYEKMVKDNPEFISYYLQFTPLDIIERATIGSRPSRRNSSDIDNVSSLRAIPWIFSWMQTRLIFPGYYGVGSSMEVFSNENNIKTLQIMYKEWPYFNSIVNNLQMICLKADMHVAESYLELVSEDKEKGTEVFETIKLEYEKTKNILQKITQSDALLETTPDIRNSIMRRNPYIDPLNLIQIELLKQWRKQNKPDNLDPQGLQRALLLTLNGIAAGLRNTG